MTLREPIRPPNAGAEADGDRRWYAVWTRSHCERLVADQLAARGFSPFLPEMSMRSKRSGATRLISVPMFPGYLLLQHHMDKRSYIDVLNARGVVRILEGGWTRLTPVPDAEVEAIRRVVDAGVPVFAHPYFRQGDRVRVVDGPLTGLEGLFVRDKPHKGRLIVSIDLLKTSVAVEVDGCFVEAALSARYAM